MSEEKLSLFIEAFRNLGDLSVLWKWDAAVPDLPANVLTSAWLPQQDVLGHPNLRVFVTHGGMGSVMEAIHHKGGISTSSMMIQDISDFAPTRFTDLIHLRNSQLKF